MESKIVLSIDHLRELCSINGRAEFYIELSGGLCRTYKSIHFDSTSNTYEILNEIDDSWQSELSEEALYSETIIPEAIQKSSMYYCGFQLWGI